MSGKSKTYNPCEKCKLVVDSFKEGLKRTERGKHEGGDAYWEEKKLSNYAISEIRLTDIQESLCQEVSSGKDQCHSFAEEYESELEEWFFQHLKKDTDLYEYLCNQVAKACCPEGHFGTNCAPCPDCKGRGYCAGNGTREGKGHCVCNRGFSGKYCSQCAKNYFSPLSSESEKQSGDGPVSELQCEPCDRSCASSCHSAGPKGCHVCAKGFVFDQETGCIDVDECDNLETNPCSEKTYCSNTIGSYKCLQCHKACKGCSAAGDQSCRECADNYEMRGGRCTAKDQPHWYQTWSRYFTYFALTGTTILVARTNMLMSWIFGLLTTLYMLIYELELTQDSFGGSLLTT